MAPLQIFPAYVWLLVAGAFGAIWGSFANVVIVRWPQDLSIAWPGSHCFSCGTPIAAYDNVPVLSFLLLRGRCRTCGGAIATRYPLVELALGLLSAACFRDTVLLAGSLEAVTLINYAVSFAFCWALVVIAFIDLATQLIPTRLTAAVTAIGLAARLLLPGGEALDGAIGVAVGFGAVWALGQGYRLLRGEVGMGLGDAHLMAMVGAIVGWRGALFCLVAGAVQGALVQLSMMLADRRWREGPVSAWRRPVPFGPFLAVGALEYVVFGASLEPYVLGLLSLR
jgi:leader peptidase (prepilin peptidase)/N-methyltransferase